MSRPKRCRRVGRGPACGCFKPAGIPLEQLDELVLEVDELEAMRLADFEGLYQEEAANRMNVSRQTFGRILTAAHYKVAHALVKGCALQIEGGAVEMKEHREFLCEQCGHQWEEPFGTGRPAGCPQCESGAFHRTDTAGACGGGRRRNRGRRVL